MELNAPLGQDLRYRSDGHPNGRDESNGGNRAYLIYMIHQRYGSISGRHTGIDSNIR